MIETFLYLVVSSSENNLPETKTQAEFEVAMYISSRSMSEFKKVLKKKSNKLPSTVLKP